MLTEQVGMEAETLGMVFTRQVNNKDLEIDCAEIRLRAKRRLGELILLQKETVGLADGGDAMRARSSASTEVRATLAEVGISKNMSSQAQKLAAVSEEEFEDMIGDLYISLVEAF